MIVPNFIILLLPQFYIREMSLGVISLVKVISDKPFSEILPTKQNCRTPKLCPAAAPNVQFDVIKSKPPFD